jgi:hypothetical protein
MIAKYDVPVIRDGSATNSWNLLPSLKERLYCIVGLG